MNNDRDSGSNGHRYKNRYLHKDSNRGMAKSRALEQGHEMVEG